MDLSCFVNFKLESKPEVFQRENIEFNNSDKFQGNNMGFNDTRTFQGNHLNCNNSNFQVDNLYNIGLFLNGRRAISLGYSAHSKLMSCGCTDGTLFVCDIGRWSSFQHPSLFLMNHHFGPIRSVSIIDRQIASIDTMEHSRYFQLTATSCITLVPLSFQVSLFR